MSHRDHIERLAVALRRSVSGEILSDLDLFAELVASWNRKMNLTAAREPRALSEVLFADALMLAEEHLLPRGARVLDVGSGAGAPAIPVALLRPDLVLTLVEPLHKRVAFMRHAIGTLKLSDRVTVLEQRLEVGDAAPLGSPFDVAMSRATLAPKEWLALGLVHAPTVLVLAVPCQDRPAVGAPPVLERLSYMLPPPALEGLTYSLPSTGAPRVIWKYERVEH